ncbi:MAG TPA: tetratricopeptide repeat protein [Vicinamibacterales bacterium]
MSPGRAFDYLTRPAAALVFVGLAAALPFQGRVRAQAAQPPSFINAQDGRVLVEGRVTFNRDVAPILYSNCTTCHRPGEAAPFSLLTYNDAKQRAGLIASVTSGHVMPPWQPEGAEGEFSGERRLLPAEIETFRRWIEDGLQEGSADDRRAVPTFSDGWQLGVPDVIVSMPVAFDVPADGADVFRNFVLPVPLNARRYVRALEFRPGNARVLHHARILLDDTGEVRLLDAKDDRLGFAGMDAPGARFPDGHFLGWAPGKAPAREAYQWPLEPGTDFIVQMHLKPTGRPEQIRASIGLYLTDEAPARTPLMLRLGSKTIDIPAGESHYEVTDRFELPVDVTALSVYPHAHYLAKEMFVRATLPNGKSTTLLHIPNWNFNWQDEYQYTQPVSLPRGATIEMHYRYDNSADNPHNPNSPPRPVVFGSETTDEMGELLVQVLTKNAEDAARLRAQAARKNLLTDVAGEEKRVADKPGDVETHNTLGVAYVQLGRVPEALEQFKTALALAPDHAQALYNLGVIAMGDQRMSEAIASFERAIAARPDYAEALNNLGVAFEATGREDDAERQFRGALAAVPSHAAAHNNLGRLLLARGNVAEAVAHFRSALLTRPDDPDALYNLGRGLVAEHHEAEAAQVWRRAIAVRPDRVTVLVDMAWLLATKPSVQNADAAVTFAEKANQLSGGGNPAVLDVLATAYASQGRMDMAARFAQRAFQRALAMKNDKLASEIRQRLEMYQTGVGSAESTDRVR